MMMMMMMMMIMMMMMMMMMMTMTKYETLSMKYEAYETHIFKRYYREIHSGQISRTWRFLCSQHSCFPTRKVTNHLKQTLTMEHIRYPTQECSEVWDIKCSSIQIVSTCKTSTQFHQSKNHSVSPANTIPFLLFLVNISGSYAFHNK